jgi:hypothetical protein
MLDKNETSKFLTEIFLGSNGILYIAVFTFFIT